MFARGYNRDAVEHGVECSNLSRQPRQTIHVALDLKAANLAIDHRHIHARGGPRYLQFVNDNCVVNRRVGFEKPLVQWIPYVHVSQRQLGPRFSMHKACTDEVRITFLIRRQLGIPAPTYRSSLRRSISASIRALWMPSSIEGKANEKRTPMHANHIPITSAHRRTRLSRGSEVV